MSEGGHRWGEAHRDQTCCQGTAPYGPVTALQSPDRGPQPLSWRHKPCSTFQLPPIRPQQLFDRFPPRQFGPLYIQTARWCERDGRSLRPLCPNVRWSPPTASLPLKKLCGPLHGLTRAALLSHCPILPHSCTLPHACTSIPPRSYVLLHCPTPTLLLPRRTHHPRRALVAIFFDLELLTDEERDDLNKKIDAMSPWLMRIEVAVLWSSSTLDQTIFRGNPHPLTQLKTATGIEGSDPLETPVRLFCLVLAPARRVCAVRQQHHVRQGNRDGGDPTEVEGEVRGQSVDRGRFVCCPWGPWRVPQQETRDRSDVPRGQGGGGQRYTRRGVPGRASDGVASDGVVRRASTGPFLRTALSPGHGLLATVTFTRGGGVRGPPPPKLCAPQIDLQISGPFDKFPFFFPRKIF